MLGEHPFFLYSPESSEIAFSEKPSTIAATFHELAVQLMFWLAVELALVRQGSGVLLMMVAI